MKIIRPKSFIYYTEVYSRPENTVANLMIGQKIKSLSIYRSVYHKLRGDSMFIEES